jgi:hypothetical protein
MGNFGFQELLMLMLLIAVLQMTGLWRVIISGLRELRGERLDEPPRAPMDVDRCYRLLGLSSSATWEEVEQAYRRKAKMHHPDHGGDEDIMRELNDAYACLKRLRTRR